MKLFWELNVLVGTCLATILPAYADNKSQLTSLLIRDRAIALDHPLFAEYSEICLIGWDRLGILPDRIRAKCGSLEDHSIVGFEIETGDCSIIANPKQEGEGHEAFNVVGELDVKCRSTSVGGSLAVTEGYGGQLGLIDFAK